MDYCVELSSLQDELSAVIEVHCIEDWLCFAER